MGYGAIVTLLLVIVLFIVILIWITSVRTKIAELEEDVISALSQLGVHMSTYTDSLIKLLDRVIVFSPNEGTDLKNELLRGDHLVVGSTKNEDIFAQEQLFAKIYRGIMKIADERADISRDYDYNRLLEDVNGVGKMVEISVRIYNSAAQKLNEGLSHFPDSCVVGVLGFKSRVIFDNTCHN